jgi:hypothetical protein
MVDQNLLTVFVALTAVAVVIQTGILLGFYLFSNKLSRQAEQALDVARNFFGPLHRTLDKLQDVTHRAEDFLATKTQQFGGGKETVSE